MGEGEVRLLDQGEDPGCPGVGRSFVPEPAHQRASAEHVEQPPGGRPALIPITRRCIFETAQTTFGKLLQSSHIEIREDRIAETPVGEEFDDPCLPLGRDFAVDDRGEASGGLLGGKAAQIFQGGVGDRVGVGFHEPG